MQALITPTVYKEILRTLTNIFNEAFCKNNHDILPQTVFARTFHDRLIPKLKSKATSLLTINVFTSF